MSLKHLNLDNSFFFGISALPLSMPRHKSWSIVIAIHLTSNMVKTRMKAGSDEPKPTTSHKNQTSNVNEDQNKRAKVDDDESNNEQSKKKDRKGTKKKGKQPR